MGTNLHESFQPGSLLNADVSDGSLIFADEEEAPFSAILQRNQRSDFHS
jgi:hypothetical protein